jgi:hydroxyethylthiazole kinase-like uncharacterized protein yjeF
MHSSHRVWPATSVPRILPVLPTASWPLHGVAASRELERLGLQATPPHALMQRAGLAVAQLALAVAPHARRVWVACGPGNNGGDGLVAALHLQQAGRQVQVSLLGNPARLPADAAHAWANARAMQLPISSALPTPDELANFDLAIDALLGLGSTRAPEGELAQAVALLNAGPAPVLAVDLPSGLQAERGQPLGAQAVRAQHTLSLLSLKPGLFTAQGRDHAGRVWLDALDQNLLQVPPSALLFAPPAPTWRARRHALHKGSFGDVLVLGGAPGMAGAAVLAARAALAAGAGRVLLAVLDPRQAGHIDPLRPELMPREVTAALRLEVLREATVAAGCGGGALIREVLPAVLHHAGRLVLDADGLNAVAAEPALRQGLRARAERGQPSVLTPHPLEAARLLGCDTAAVQADRLGQAQRLAEAMQATVVLKGSGSVIASPGATPCINPTGNARLASGGTGDVLAGWLGGHWSAQAAQGTDGDAQTMQLAHGAHAAACASVWLHGRAAEWGTHDGPAAGTSALPLRAADLIEAMRHALPAG